MASLRTSAWEANHKDDTDKPVVLVTFCNSQAINARLGQLVMKNI